jgi:glycosyltransferase involved in cell wall biosynthesis
VIIDMWNGISYWLAAAASKVSGTHLLLTNDSSIIKKMDEAKWKREVKKFFLTMFLLPLASGFLYRTEVNFQLFRFYGIPERFLFFYPLSVDFEGLYHKYSNLKEEKFGLRLKYKVPKDAFLILFVGRLAKEKRPQDLLEAYSRLSIPNKALIFVGDGELRILLQETVEQKYIKNVYFMGFRPRTEIPNFYAMADLLVLPSEIEPHGDVVKEAMCFALPVIVSDKVGASADIVMHRKNGYIYKCSEIGMLSFYIGELLDEGRRKNFGRMALEEVKKWDHNVAINGLLYALDCVVKNKE